MNFQEFIRRFQKKEVCKKVNSVTDSPLISICVQTYQHVNYIKECLDGILMQKTDFTIEILLGDDESMDGTREICIEYAEKFPSKIRLFLHHRVNNIKINDNSTGRFNFLFNLYSARGKFIALCEGDDYWTDPYKLQKQVDFLEANDEFGICFHNVEQQNIFTNQSQIIPNVKTDAIFSMSDYIINNRTATSSIFFDRKFLGEIPGWFLEVPFGDLGLILIVMENSNRKGMVLKDTMSVYRIHEKGIHGFLQKNGQSLIKAYHQHLIFNKLISSRFLNSNNFKPILLEKEKKTYLKLANLYWKEGERLNGIFFFLKSKFIILRRGSR